MNTFRLISKRTSLAVGAHLRCFCFNGFRVVSVWGCIPFRMWLAASLIALSTLPFSICSTNFFESCACLRLLGIVSPSFRISAKCSAVHYGSLLSRALVWPLVFESLLGFCSKRQDMIITAFNAIFFSGEPLTHASINLVPSPTKHLPLLPVGKRKIFFFQ